MLNPCMKPSIRINIDITTLEQFKVPIAANWKGVCLQNTSKPHSYILKYDYYDFMDR